MATGKNRLLPLLRNIIHRNTTLSEETINKVTPPTSNNGFGQPDHTTHPHLLEPGEVTHCLSKHEYQRRREKLMDLVKSSSGNQFDSHIVIVPSATKQYMTADIPYSFRQNTDFLYLCGFKEPDSLLVLENKPGKSSSDVKSTLFVPKKNPQEELWDGPRSGAEGSFQLTGVDQSMNNDEFLKYMQCVKDRSNVCVWYDNATPIHQRFNKIITESVLKADWVSKVKGIQTLVHHLRVVKSDAERKIMAAACHITSESFRDTIRFTAPNVDESFLHALMDYSCRIRGAQNLAYPPVVAAGPRSNIIHYISNDQIVREDDLVLLDAGCEYHGYNSDVTRTYPASGGYSRKQTELYEAVLAVQEDLIATCMPGHSLALLYQTMVGLLANQLKKLGLIAQYVEGDELKQAVRRYCPHDVGHYLGMDIHDTPSVSRHAPLSPGMVITIEPGLYINENDSEASPEWRGVGIRIEDNILITDGLPQNLTYLTPKTVMDIETAMINTC